MVEFLSNYQLNIMLALSSACGVIALFVLITKALSKSRRRALLLLELSSMFLLYFDRLAYMFSGNQTPMGFVMVRVTNFVVFSMTLMVSLSLNLYLIDLLTNEGGLKKTPIRLRLVTILCFVGISLIVFSQFTGLYYYFDEENKYVRGSGFLLCYLFPVLVSLIQLSVIIQYMKKLNTMIGVSLVLFITLPLVASAVQIKAYGLSLTNMSIVGVAIFLYIVALFDINKKVEHANRVELEYLQEESKSMQRLFEQTASAFVDAIDIKDIYTTGHSKRVANYARIIAEIAGKDEKTCDEVYYAALLHDVGKIGIPDSILQNEGKLSDEEYEIWKTRSDIGNDVLSKITEYPYLKDGAHYVHERYDGSGYPEGLKGEDIPEIARIVAVADYYDALTSKKSYRDFYPQPFVREAFIKGYGTLFDPKFAQIMLDLIDADKEYLMRESSEEGESLPEKEYEFGEYRTVVSKGIPVENTVTGISFKCELLENSPEGFAAPSLVVFDAYDGRVHDSAKTIDAFRYLEYAEVWFDGHSISTNARSVKSRMLEKGDVSADNVFVKTSSMKGVLGDSSSDNTSAQSTKFNVEIIMGRYEDHVKLLITSNGKSSEVLIALPDSSKYAYIGLTGEYCKVSDLTIEKTEEKVRESDIERIAPKQVYTNRLEGDLPNIQIDRRRSASSTCVNIMDGLRLAFHTMSLPSANLVWHCPYIVIYYSDDQVIGGKNYREFALIKMNGESESSDENSENKIVVKKTEEFTDWETWENRNMEGVDCEVFFERSGNKITVYTENAGLTIKNTTVIKDHPATVYAALTGDRCALTTIRIK